MPLPVVAVLLCAACSGAPVSSDQPDAKPPTPLGLLMKDQINPAFSKLSFLIFHGDSMDDPAAVEAELQRTAATLKAGTLRLREWPEPPVTTAEGREVFYTFSTSVDLFAGRLVEAAGRRETALAGRHLEQIAKACNDCHHFFRLKLKDSVVGPGAPPPPP